ncbi:GlxA family transcriptional regulator [Phenylobacterium sp.]|jgi:transcriptional regulator GlxA family with amidase domain|uniref:GlxA family transcriptional regulator n=1 Tax=Phenylobacterium sp. TaxID=1871053 RepID=UPI002F42A8E3
MATKTVGIVGYDGVNALDLSGPQEVFASGQAVTAGGAPAYEVIVLSPDGRPFRSRSGLRIMADAALADAPPLDTLVVAGGTGIRAREVLEPIGAWVGERAAGARRVVSVCTGLYGLAESGLMDGRRATTHWRYADEVRARYPAVLLDPDAIFVRDGIFATSAGVTAGIDLALALVEEDLGPSVALAIARMLVVYVRRSGGQRQYSEPLRFQARAAGRFADLAAWIPANLAGDLSIEALAGRVNCSPRHFARLFKDSFGAAPGEYVEALRLAEAAERLITSTLPADRIAASVGYASGDVFRRAFERRFGVTPSAYRARFTSTPLAAE